MIESGRAAHSAARIFYIRICYDKLMARVMTIYNAKGGVGKTTTAINLAAYLALFGERTLLIDFDPQFNASAGTGFTPVPGATVYEALIGSVDPKDIIQQTPLHNLHLMPASADLSGSLIELVNVPERELYMRRLIEKVKDDYDYILIDMGPSLNLLSVNGLMAADEIIVPLQCEQFSIEGLAQLLETIGLVQNNLGHGLKIAGALLTMYDDADSFSREIAGEIRRRFPYAIFRTSIPKSPSLAEAPRFRRPVVLYDPKSPGAQSYEALAREVREQNQQIIHTGPFDAEGNEPTIGN